MLDIKKIDADRSVAKDFVVRTEYSSHMYTVKYNVETKVIHYIEWHLPSSEGGKPQRISNFDLRAILAIMKEHGLKLEEGGEP